MYQLHYCPSNANAAPHVVLEEFDQKYDLVLVDRAKNAQKSKHYLKINPNGRIPTLVDGDLAMFEAAAIVLHLVDQQEELMTASTLSRSRALRSVRNHIAARCTNEPRFHRVDLPRARQAARLTSITAATVMIAARNIHSTKINQKETYNEYRSCGNQNSRQQARARNNGAGAGHRIAAAVSPLEPRVLLGRLGGQASRAAIRSRTSLCTLDVPRNGLDPSAQQHAGTLRGRQRKYRP